MLTVNSYFDSKVKSIAFKGESLPATIGVISPGEYAFDTSKHETITIISGTLTVKLPDNEKELTYKAGETFEVVAGVIFSVKAEQDVAYLCTYQ